MNIALPIYQTSDLYYPISYKHIDLLSNFAIPVICKSQEIRDRLVEKCSNRIEIRPIIGGDMTLQPFFGKYMKEYANNLGESNSSLVHRQGLYFGNNPELTKKEISVILKIFLDN